MGSVKQLGATKLASSELSPSTEDLEKEFSLHVDVTMADKESVKMKLFSYLIRERGREISETLCANVPQAQP